MAHRDHVRLFAVKLSRTHADRDRGRGALRPRAHAVHRLGRRERAAARYGQAALVLACPESGRRDRSHAAPCIGASYNRGAHIPRLWRLDVRHHSSQSHRLSPRSICSTPLIGLYDAPDPEAFAPLVGRRQGRRRPRRLPLPLLPPLAQGRDAAPHRRAASAAAAAGGPSSASRRASATTSSTSSGGTRGFARAAS